MLCTQVLNGAVSAFKVLKFNIGDEFEVVTVSFNPKETPAMAAAKKSTYLAKYGRPAGARGWHFLTGEQPAIDAVASSVGFRYVFDRASQQYVHASALMVITPQGRVSKYFYGIDYPPKDIRLGLIEASGGKIGSPVDEVLLYCFHYDPHSGKYSMVVMNVLRLAGGLTVALIVGAIMMMWSLDRRKSKDAAALAPPVSQ
jgi:protein SCO1/2